MSTKKSGKPKKLHSHAHQVIHPDDADPTPTAEIGENGDPHKFHPARHRELGVSVGGETEVPNASPGSVTIKR